jgi:hypothetical protein
LIGEEIFIKGRQLLEEEPSPGLRGCPIPGNSRNIFGLYELYNFFRLVKSN